MDERASRAAEALGNGGRALVTRLEHLGDVILTLPVLDALRERFPRAELDYLCRPPSSDLLTGDPRVDRVFVVESGRGLRDGFSLVRRLRRRRYAVTIDLYANPRSAWLTWLAAAPVRIGGNRRGRRRLYTHPVDVPPEVRSAMDFHLRHLEPLGVRVVARKPVWTPSPDEVGEARAFLSSRGMVMTGADGPLVGVHPGGKWEVKRWPVRRFAELIEMLQRERRARVVVLTGPGEASYSRQLAASTGDGPLYLPELPIRRVGAILSLLDGMVVSDGGIMHLSVAVGTPTVGIFGSAMPDIWFPYENFGPFLPALIEIDCRPCHRHLCPYGHTNCLNRLSADMVLSRLDDAIRRVRLPTESR